MIPGDTSVPGHTRLFRRVHPNEVVWDDNDNCPRPNSGVFKDIDMSVHMGDVLDDEGREPVSVLVDKPGYCLVVLTAGFVQEEQQEVRRTPLPDDGSHGEVFGHKPKGRRRLFARMAEFEVFREDGLRPEIRARLNSGAIDED